MTKFGDVQFKGVEDLDAEVTGVIETGNITDTTTSIPALSDSTVTFSLGKGNFISGECWVNNATSALNGSSGVGCTFNTVEAEGGAMQVGNFYNNVYSRVEAIGTVLVIAGKFGINIGLRAVWINGSNLSFKFFNDHATSARTLSFKGVYTVQQS